MAAGASSLTVFCSRDRPTGGYLVWVDNEDVDCDYDSHNWIRSKTIRRFIARVIIFIIRSPAASITRFETCPLAGELRWLFWFQQSVLILTSTSQCRRKQKFSHSVAMRSSEQVLVSLSVTSVHSHLLLSNTYRLR